ncbi:MAG: efflux RND transporter permease subunit, partial [Pseudomonadota bacterium]
AKLKGLTGGYVRLLSFALRHPAKILFIAVAMLITTPIVYGTFGKGVEFFPDVEPEQGIVLIHARGNMSVWEQDTLVRQVENEVLKLSDEFKSIYSLTGPGGDGEDVAEDVIGQISLEFEDWQNRRPAAEIYDDIRQLTAHLAGVYVEARSPEAGPPTGKPVQVQLTSRFPELLPPAVEKVRAYFEAQPGLIDIEDSRPLPGIDWRLEVDRAQALKFGIDTSSLGDSIKLVTRGLNVGGYRPNDSDEEIDMVLRFPEELRSMDELDSLRVIVNREGIPASNFVERVAQQKTGTISRIDGYRVMDVQANVEEGVLPDDIVTGMKEWLATEANLDPRVEAVFKGEDEEQQAAESFLSRAFAVALFIMAIILITQFNSFYSAFLILSA